MNPAALPMLACELLLAVNAVMWTRHALLIGESVGLALLALLVVGVVMLVVWRVYRWAM